MTAVEILSVLIAYRAQVMEVAELHDQDVTIDVSNAYSFIDLDIRKAGEPFAHIRFQVYDDHVQVYQIYCHNKADEAQLTERIGSVEWPGWESANPTMLPYTGEVLSLLATADEIASLAKNCTRGDEYRPGNFSKISLKDEAIELQQINHMNSRSLDHKKDYSLRDLVFVIPFGTSEVKRLHASYRIGRMLVEFSDRSSANKKFCGDQIEETLERLGARI